eukprot:4073940-Pleurochrysis_carterae.AAC.2
MLITSHKTLLAVDGGDHARSRRSALRRAIALDLMCIQIGNVSCSSTYSRAAFTRVVSELHGALLWRSAPEPSCAYHVHTHDTHESFLWAQGSACRSQTTA